jgi:hypothetical protein
MIKLIKTRRGCAMLEKQDRYDVEFDGKVIGQLWFNMRGYVGTLPSPEGLLCIGELSITRYKAEVVKLNREWKRAAV